MHPPRGNGIELDPLERWQSVVDRAIREAQRRGDFDDLPGHGKPLDLEEDNPFAAERAMGFRVLKNAGMKPPWMELEAEIGAGHAALAELRDRTTGYLHAHLARARSGGIGREPSARAGGARMEQGRRFGWPFRRGRSQVRSTDAPSHPTMVELEMERQRARRAYLERATRLDETIRRYNAALPNELRWRERPRLPPDQAARDFDAACPPISDDALP